MNWWLPHHFDEKREFLSKRMQIIRGLRRNFDGRGFWEVETPALQICPTVDTHIHAVKAPLRGPDLQPLRDYYLHTSPEFAMKKLLVAGLPQIYQICHVFRDGEKTRLHSPEFTMLEWYRSGADYHDSMDDCVDTLRIAAESAGTDTYTHQGITCRIDRNICKISVEEVFMKYAGIDLSEVMVDTELFRVRLIEAGIRVAEGDRWDDLFFRVMAARIEPHLGHDEPAFLYDYPVCLGALAKEKQRDRRYAERFELYVCGVELANGFSELTHEPEQKRRIEADMELKESLYGERYPVDEDFLAALRYGLPECSGVALGVDRLVMLACGVDKIEDILWTGSVYS